MCMVRIRSRRMSGHGLSATDPAELGEHFECRGTEDEIKMRLKKGVD